MPTAEVVAPAEQRRFGAAWLASVALLAFVLAWYISAPPWLLVKGRAVYYGESQQAVLGELGSPDERKAIHYKEPGLLGRLWQRLVPPPGPLAVEEWLYYRPRFFWESPAAPTCEVAFDASGRVRNSAVLRPHAHDPAVFWTALLAAGPVLGVVVYGIRAAWTRRVGTARKTHAA